MPKTSRPQYLVNDRGRRTAVVLSMTEYNKLIEDLHDLSVVAERRDEETVSFDDLRNRLKADGLIQD